MSWIRDLINPNARTWEEFYRNRWQHDRVVRSTHGVNCTGSCSWMIYVKDGIVTWEMQATDYPKLEAGLPGYEPRGCPRGIVFSWYIYSPLRIKYPYVRGVLLDAWREARSRHADPVEAWTEIMDNAEARRQYQAARGRGGFRRTSWDESLEIVAASLLYTAKKYGPDRVAGFSPIPAMSMLSYAAGSRFLQLFGGSTAELLRSLCGLPSGIAGDVGRKDRRRRKRRLVQQQIHRNHRQQPQHDAHSRRALRRRGAQQRIEAGRAVARFQRSGTLRRLVDSGALRNGCGLLDGRGPRHSAGISCGTAGPLFRKLSQALFRQSISGGLDKSENGYTAGRFLRAGRLARYAAEENGDWKFLVFDAKTGEPRMPRGAIGSRWQAQKGRWNLELKDDLDGTDIDPLLSLLESRDAELPVTFADSANNLTFQRNVPVRYVETADGRIAVTTVYDLLMAQYGVPRGLAGRLSARLQRRKCAVHAGLAGEIHRHQPQHGDPICPRVCFHRREDRRQMHGHCRLRREPLVSQQPALPCFHRCPDPLRLYRSQWRRAESLHGPGKACARGVLVAPWPWRSTGRRRPGFRMGLRSTMFTAISGDMKRAR